MADQSLEKEFQRVLTLIQRDRLTERFPHLKTIIPCIPPTPGCLREQLITTVIAAAAAYEKGLIENPFPSGFLDRLRGALVIAAQKRDGALIGIDPITLCSGMLVQGATGSAKTSFVNNVVHGLRVLCPNVIITYLDPKLDWQGHAYRDHRCIPVWDDLPLNTLVPPTYIRPEQYWALWVRDFCRANYGAYHMARTLTDVIKTGFARYPNGPSIADLVTIINGQKTVTFQQRDALANTITRFQTFQAVMPGAYYAKPPHCLTMQDIVTSPMHFPLLHDIDAMAFLFAWWVTNRFLRNQIAGMRGQLNTLLVTDEGMSVWAKSAGTISGDPILGHLVSMTREVGIGFLITTTSLKLLDQLTKANMNLHAVMPLADGGESWEVARTLRLNQAQQVYLDHRLQRGECILRLGNQYQEPLLATFLPPVGSKTVSSSEWEEAKQRATALLPAPLPILTVIANTKSEKSEVPVPSSHGPTEPHPLLRLSGVEEAMLRHIGSNVIVTVSELYDAIGLHYAVGDKAKTKLLQLGLVTGAPIVARSGRGGRAIALQSTPLGYARMGVAPPRRSRGGAAQAEYLIQSLHKLLPGSSIEVSLG